METIIETIYVLRTDSYDETASYHHYQDIAFFKEKTLAEEWMQKLKDSFDNTRFWINEERVTHIKVFI